MNPQDVLAQIDAAIKAITVSDLGNAKLAPEAAAKFVKAAQDASPMLKAARRLDMSSHTRNIDRVGFGSRILGAATEATAYSTESEPTFATNQLISKEVVAVVNISDSAMEDNIEQGNFEDTLIQLIGARAGLDMEELFVQGDTGSGTPFLALTNGWLKKATGQLTGVASEDFTITSVVSMFDAQLLALPTKFHGNRADLAFYVPFAIENDYRDVLAARGTALGDLAYSSGNVLAYKGIKVVEVANMPTGKSLLVNANNLVYGIYRDIRIETDRNVRARSTDYVLTARIDCHFEDENGAVAAIGYTG